MSNLLYNGNFSLPLIPTDSYNYTNTLTAQQQTDLGWSFSGDGNTALQNGSTEFGYPTPSVIGLTQFISLQRATYISQSFSVTNVGYYELSFKYTSRPNYIFNNALVKFDGNVIVTVPTPISESWVTYSKIFNISSIGTHTLMIQGSTPGYDYNIAITSIVLKQIFMNNLKNTNVFGYLTVNELNQNGVTTSNGGIQTKKLILNGKDMNTEVSTDSIKYNYSTLPARVSTNIGYQYYSVIGTNKTATGSGFTTITNISGVPIGVYHISFSLRVARSGTSTGFIFYVTLNTANPLVSGAIINPQPTYDYNAAHTITINNSFIYSLTTNNSTFYIVCLSSGCTIYSSTAPAFKITRIA